MKNELEKIILENLPELKEFREKENQWLRNNEVNSWSLPMQKSKKFEGVFKISEDLDIQVGKYEVGAVRFLGGYGIWNPLVYLGDPYIDHGCFRYPCMKAPNELLWLLQKYSPNKINVVYLKNREVISEKFRPGLGVDAVLDYVAKNAEPNEKHWDVKLRLLIEGALGEKNETV